MPSLFFLFFHDAPKAFLPNGDLLKPLNSTLQHRKTNRRCRDVLHVSRSRANPVRSLAENYGAEIESANGVTGKFDTESPV
jgi:hypothetical protein